MRVSVFHMRCGEDDWTRASRLGPGASLTGTYNAPHHSVGKPLYSQPFNYYHSVIYEFRYYSRNNTTIFLKYH